MSPHCQLLTKIAALENAEGRRQTSRFLQEAASGGGVSSLSLFLRGGTLRAVVLKSIAHQSIIEVRDIVACGLLR